MALLLEVDVREWENIDHESEIICIFFSFPTLIPLYVSLLKDLNDILNCTTPIVSGDGHVNRCLDV